MKQVIFLSALSMLLLTGCSQEAEPTASAKAMTEPAVETAEFYEGYVKNPQVTDDRELNEVGKTIRDNRGELTLQAINSSSQTVKVGSVELTIHETKTMHFKPDYSLIDFYHSYTHEPEFNLAKVFVTIKNTSDEPLNFAPVATVMTSTGELKTWEDDVYLEELNGKLEAGETKRGNLGFIIEHAELEALTITTSDVFNEQEEKTADSQAIEVELE